MFRVSICLESQIEQFSIFLRENRTELVFYEYLENTSKKGITSKISPKMELIF